MTRGKLVLLSLVAVLAASAVASASASAAFDAFICQKVATGGHWKNAACSENSGSGFETQEITTQTKIEGTGLTAILKSEIGTTKIYIDCQKTKATGTIEKDGKTTATIEYEECKLYEETTGKVVSNCEVPTITAKVLDKLEGSKGAIEDQFTPAEGEKFAQVKIEGASCVLKGTFEVKGSQKCKLPGAETFLESHELKCEESGSSLKFGTKEATYRGIVGIILSLLHDCWRIRFF